MALADFERPVVTALHSTMLHRSATLDDVGNVACFAASDWARTITATAINMTCGTQVD
jgi:enoyl-[acyl-carrier-protein] reductase (NADH)